MDIPEPRPDGPAFNDSPHLMAVIAPDGVLKVVNAAWERILGYRAAELIGRNLLRLVDDPDRAMARRLLNSSSDDAVGLAFRCKDVTDQRRLEVTQSLRLYDLHAEAAKQKKT
jgi:PAS domain-containing protein